MSSAVQMAKAVQAARHPPWAKKYAPTKIANDGSLSFLLSRAGRGWPALGGGLDKISFVVNEPRFVVFALSPVLKARLNHKFRRFVSFCFAITLPLVGLVFVANLKLNCHLSISRLACAVSMS